MTLYWWSHWFWITLISVLATLPFTSVATYPISSSSLEKIKDLKSIEQNNEKNNNNNDNSNKPLDFPMPAHTDVDDIYPGGGKIPQTLLIKEEIIEKFSRNEAAVSSDSASEAGGSLALVSDGNKAKIESQLSDRSVVDVNQSIEKQHVAQQRDKAVKDQIENTEMTDIGNNITHINSNNNSKNGISDASSSKSVIQLIPKVSKRNDKANPDAEIAQSQQMSSTISMLARMQRQQTESLDVVSFDKIISNSNDTNNNSNTRNISTNISLGEKTHEQLQVMTTASPSSTTTTTTAEYLKPVSHIMQVTSRSSSKIRSKTSISRGGDFVASSSSNESASATADGIDQTTNGNDDVPMTTILHPVGVDHVRSRNISEEDIAAEDFVFGVKKTHSDDDDDGDDNAEDANGSTGEKIPATLENVTKFGEKSLSKESDRVRKSKGLSSEYRDAFINNYSADAKSLLTRSAGQEDDFLRSDDGSGNVSSEALQIKRAYLMDAGTISGICLSVLAVCCGVGTVGIVLYRRRFLNKPQALSEPDSSVYIDDSTIRDNSDEMYSLDNDSFLNSLEAMTIQNYWTDTVKHTKL